MIPDQAYLYFPKESEIVQQNSKDVNRIFYDGDIDYLNDENQVLEKFISYLSEPSECKTLMQMGRNCMMRFLYSEKFDFDKAKQDLISYKDLLKSIQNYDQKTIDLYKQILDLGWIYVTGRDNRFRPIIVFISNKIDLNKFQLDQFLGALGYFFVSVLNQLMLPGQVEQWIIITDLCHLGLTDVPLNIIMKTIGFLQKYFKGHLYRMYIVNACKSITFPWYVVKGILAEQTTLKIQIYGNNSPQQMFSHINIEQLPVEYGGSYTVQQYWPFQLSPSLKFFTSTDKSSEILITIQEYQFKHQRLLLRKSSLNTKFLSSSDGNSSDCEEEVPSEPISQYSIYLIFNTDSKRKLSIF